MKLTDRISFPGLDFLALSILLLLSGCNISETKEKQREAELLYSESYKLIKIYTDSLRQANDTASVQRLSENFENRIAKINFKYKADADLEMTEQENDTLSKLLETYVSVRQSRLNQFHLASSAVEGQLESDSISGTDE